MLWHRDSSVDLLRVGVTEQAHGTDGVRTWRIWRSVAVRSVPAEAGA